MSMPGQTIEGLLDEAILGLVAQGETCGYEIMTRLKNQEFPEISEGSTYLVLVRLDKRGYADTTIKKSSNDNLKRKCHTITDSGLRELKISKPKRQVLNKGTTNLFGEENDIK